MKIRCYDVRDRIVMFDLPEYGVLTPQVRWVLLNGHCHSFALALRRLTNWPLVGRCDGRAVGHVFCARPNPLTLIDAAGTLVYDEEIMQPIRGLDGYKFAGKRWLKPEVDAVMPFAESRLKELQREDGSKFYPQKYPFLGPKPAELSCSG
jgi:hypothetical protein